MSPHPNISTALARVVVDELVAGGLEVIVICPGSRSAALAIAAAEHAEVSDRVFIDERSAGFYALGVARASGGPAAVLTTSGTAAANLYPAVVEAAMSCVPLVVLSADRPPEMRGVGSNQTIDQFELFGSHVRRFDAIDPPVQVLDLNEEWRDTTASALAAAMGRPPGPVQLNVSFREPTVPVLDDGRSQGVEYPFDTPRMGGALSATMPVDPWELPPGRGLVIAGDGHYDREGLLSAASAIGWPVLATALSGLRGHEVVGSYREVLRSGIPEDLTPEIVVAAGAIGPDPVLEDLLASANHRIRVDVWGRAIDPRRNATRRVVGDPVRLIRSVRVPAPAEWRTRWLESEASASARMTEEVRSRRRPSGGGVASAVNDVEWGALVVASSLPIREVDAHLRTSGPVYANRGASGIDGFISTALGVSSVKPRTLALAGDLSFLHDNNGFLNDHDHDLTVVVIDNRGGGLFDSLPQAQHAPQYERLFVTPPRRDLVDLARFHGARVNTVATIPELVATMGSALGRSGLDVVVVPVDRGYDADVRG